MRKPGIIPTVAQLFTIWIGMVLGTDTWATITFELDSVITGGSPASAAKPWLTAAFSSAANNQVALVLSAPNLSGDEDVKDWLFNIDPTITPAQLNTISIASKTVLSGSVTINNVSLIKKSVDGVTRAGFSFDIELGLPDGNRSKRFTQGDQLQIILKTSLAPDILALNEAIFNFPDDTGTYHSTAHIRNTTVGENSGWIGDAVVPEPSTFLAGALLLLPFGASALRLYRQRV